MQGVPTQQFSNTNQLFQSVQNQLPQLSVQQQYQQQQATLAQHQLTQPVTNQQLYQQYPQQPFFNNQNQFNQEQQFINKSNQFISGYIHNNNNNNNNFHQGNQLAGAQQQASSCLNPVTILASQQQQPFVYQPPNSFASSAQVASIGGDQVIANDPYNIPANQLAHQQQQLFNTQQQQQQQPGRPFSQQQLPLNSHIRHHLSHQRSLPLPPPILQQLQARQQQQQLQRHYYQAANKLLFDDQRYYPPAHPLSDQLGGPNHFYAQPALLSDNPYFNQYHHQRPHSRRPNYNLESTRGLNNSLQSQWLYGGGGGRRSMAGDLLFSAQASALGDPSDTDQKIVNDFCLLYNESRQLFNGLR